jgi:hypothetical protein
MIDADALVRWLGPAGAKAGLLESDLSLADLTSLAKANRLPLSPKPTREEAAHEIAYSSFKTITASTEELLAMQIDQLTKYFKKTKPSRSEVIKILTELGVSIGSNARKGLYVFAAREISDLGMYQRVAQGPRSRSAKPE